MAFVLTPSIGFWGALLVAPIATAVLGFIVERLMIQRATTATRSTACC